MDPPDDLEFLQSLDQLTRDLDRPGADLHAMLSVLTDDITAAAPSFLGLRMTITVDEITTTVNAIDQQGHQSARASLLLPLHDITADGIVGTVILFASELGAFDELATHARHAFNLDGQVVIDKHLPVDGKPVAARGVSGMDAASLVNIAIGFLIDQGHPPDEARQELIRRAAAHGGVRSAAAQEIIDRK